MSNLNFDIENYLDARAKADSPYARTEDASQEKTAKLEQNRLAEEARKKTWAGQLGLSPEGNLGQLVNFGASVASGTAAMGGRLSSLPVSIADGYESADVTQNDLNAYNRLVTGAGTPEDQATLNQVTPNNDTTILQRIKKSNELRGGARAINDTFDISSIVDQTKRNKLNADLAEGFNANWEKANNGAAGAERSKAVMGLLTGAGSAVLKNKTAALEYAFENAPQLVVGAFGKLGAATMTADNVAYATDAYQKGKENYVKEHAGQLPSLEKQNTMALQAVTLAAAEHAGDVGSLVAGRAFKSIGNSAKELLTNVAEGTASGVAGAAARTSLKKALLQTAKGAGEGILSEGPTEAYQTYMEGEIAGKSATPLEIYTSGVIGAASGGILSGSMRGVHEAGALSAQKTLDKGVDGKPVNPAVTDLTRSGIKTGDVTALADPTSKSYAPNQAIAALFGNTQQDATKGQENLAKADEIIGTLETKVAQIQSYLTSPAEIQAKLDDVIKQRDALPVDSTDREDLDFMVEKYQDDLAKPLNEENRLKAEKDLKKHQDMLDSSNEVFSQLKNLATTKPITSTEPIPESGVTASIAELVKQVNTPAEGIDPVVPAKKLVLAAMEDPEALDPKVATELAENTANGLDASQRAFLRTFSEARMARNASADVGSVTKAIYEGDRHNVGIKEREDNFGYALKTNNPKAAQRQISGTESFLKSHQDKADAFVAASKIGKGTQIIKTISGGWQVNPVKFTDEKLKTNGGLTYTNDKFKDNLVAEADALTKSLSHMQAAFDLKFNKPPKAIATKAKVEQPKEITNVKDTTKTRTGEEANPTAPKVQATEATGSTGTSTGTIARAPTDASSQPTANSVDEKTSVDKESTKTTEASVEKNVVSKPLLDLNNKNLDKQLETIHDFIIDNLNGGYDKTTVNQVKEWATKEKQRLSSQSLKEGSAAANERNALLDTIDQTVADIEEGLNGDFQEKALSTKTSTNEVLITKENKPAESGTVEEHNPTPGLPTLVQGREFNKQFVGKKLGEIYQKLNQAAAWVTQKINKKETNIGKNQPLVSIDGFLSRWMAKDIDLQSFFENELSEDQRSALETFMSTVQAWAPEIAKDFIKGSLKKSLKEDYKYKDPIQDFLVLDEKGKTHADENLISAIAYGAFSWYVENAGLVYQTKEGVLKMHGFKEGQASISLPGYKALQMMNGSTDNIVAGMGERIIQALGLQISKEAPVDYAPRLASALGAHALRTLQRQKLVEVKTFKESQLSEWIDKIDPREGVTRSYIKFRRDKDMALLGKNAERIKNSQKATGGVLTEMMTAEASKRYASTRPGNYTEEHPNKTQQGIPAELRKDMERIVEMPHTVIPAVWRSMQVIGEKAIMAALGWIDPESPHIHIENRKGYLAKNNALEEQYSNTIDLIESHKDGQKFYIQPSVASNFRVHIATSDLNPQSSKLQRFVFQRPEWNSYIDMNNPEMLMHYEMGLAQAFGMKIDAKSFSDVQTDFQAMLDDPSTRVTELAEALYEAQRDSTTFSLTEEQQEAIGALAAGREGMQTVQALVSLGQYLKAIEQGAKGFNTTLLVGVDGKTNGPILTILALGAGQDKEGLLKQINRGGFYGLNDNTKNYNEWYQQSDSLDLYEALAAEILKNVDAKSAPMLAIQIILKDLINGDNGITSAARSLAKTPMTSFAFASSVDTSFANMQGQFVKAIFERLQDISSGAETKITLKQLIDAINFLVSNGDERTASIDTFHQVDYNKELLIVPGTPITDLLNQEWSKERKEAIMVAFDAVLGEPVKQAMNSLFDVFIERRNSVNKTVTLAFEIYHAVASDLRKIELNRLMDEGLIAFKEVKGERVPLHDMTQEQINNLRKSVDMVLPLLHTPYSKKEDNLKASLNVAKTTKSQGQEDFHKVQAYFGQSFSDDVMEHNQRMVLDAVVRGEMGPGVAAMAWMMHSEDSAIMHRATRGTQTLNVHDEAAGAANKVVDTAKAMNNSTWETTLHYSPPTEAFEMLQRGIINVVALAKEGKVSGETLNNIASQVRQALPYDKEGNRPSYMKALMAYAVQAKATEREAMNVRLSTMAELAHLDQYTWQDGQADITDDMRAEATRLLDEYNKNNSQLSEELITAINEFNKFLKADANKATSEVTQPKETSPIDLEPDSVEDGGTGVETKPITSPKATVGKTHPAGTLGRSVKVHEPALVAFFKANPKTTASEALEQLLKIAIAAPKGQSYEFNKKLLQLIKKRVRSDLPITYVTENTNPKDILDIEHKDAKKSLGWYSPGDAANGVADGLTIIGTDFVRSKVSFELVIHELVHAALIEITESGSKEAAPFVEELNNLLEAAQKYVASNEKLKKYKYATSNLNELIAYGMTNQNFRNDVLNNLTIKSTLSGKIEQGIKNFVKAIAGMLGFKTNAEVNGLEAFFNSTVSLLAIDTQTKEDTSLRAPSGMKDIDAIQSYNSMELFQALDNDKTSPEFKKELQGLLSGIVDTLHGPLGSLYEAMRDTEAGNPLAVWLRTLESGKAPLASQLVASPLASTAQQDFVAQQVEATVKAAITGNDAANMTAYKVLANLYKEAYNKLEPKDFYKRDWATASVAAQELAKEKYDFIFKLDSSKGDRSDYLARFAALGLSNEEFNSLLKFDTIVEPPGTKEAKTLLGKLANFFYKALDYFTSKSLSTYGGQQADEKLKELAQRLVDVEAKKRNALMNKAATFQPVTFIEDKTKEVMDSARSKLEQAANSDFVKKHKSAYIGAIGTLTQTIVGGRTDAFMDTIGKIRDKYLDERSGFLSALMNDIKHPSDMLKVLHRATKRTEQQRMDVIAGTSKLVRESFADKGKGLTHANKAAFSAVLLRTGAYALRDKLSMADMENILSNKKDLEKEIDSYINQLTGPNVGHYLHQIKSLAYQKVTGEAVASVLMMNASNIARMYGTTNRNNISDAQAKTNEPIIEALIALYGIQYSDSADVALVKDLVSKENSRSDGNGVQFVLDLHKHLGKESQAYLFDENKTLMAHGYLPEEFNPYIQVTSATEEEGRDLLDQGYTLVGDLSIDPRDTLSSAKKLYVLKDGGNSSRVSGAIAINSQKAKGSEFHSGYLNTRDEVGLTNAVANTAMLNGGGSNVNLPISAAKSFDPTKSKKRYMVPVLNEKGKIVNWRYMMKESLKDSLLERNNDFDELLGAMAGSVVHKPMAKDQNAIAIKALHEQFVADYANNSERYLDIGPNVKDPEMVQVWNMLSYSTQQSIKKVWGENKMTVRKDAVDVLFGYRKASAADMFKSAHEERKQRKAVGLSTDTAALETVNAMQKIAIAAVESILVLQGRTQGLTSEEAHRKAAKAAVTIARGERMWQEVVKAAKDNIVIKNGVTLLGNIYSNLWLLKLNKIPMKDIAIHHVAAIKAATAYRGDTEELAKLKTYLATGYTQGKEAEIRRNITLLEDAIARNPAKILIDEGLMPTIVDDVEVGKEDRYSYKSALSKKVDKYMDKIPDVAKSALRNIYLSHDTPLYQFLSNTTQLSDFVARYTMFQHYTTRAVDPMTREQAIKEASDSFINYDLPMPKALQYTDDMGITMFTKYFLRIQKVLLKLFKENPAGVLTTIAAGHFMTLGSTVLDGHWMHHLGNNPLSVGPLNYPRTLDNLATISYPMAIIK